MHFLIKVTVRPEDGFTVDSVEIYNHPTRVNQPVSHVFLEKGTFTRLRSATIEEGNKEDIVTQLCKSLRIKNIAFHLSYISQMNRLKDLI